ncbi:MAG: class I SAM-dependent methyltransferase [Calditrichaeota bacterium]|nr:class I SAM-dependent methyltransferase [Calditrichota bacterium]
MWDQRYNTPEYIYGKTPNDFLVEMIDRLPKGEVLSLAEGEGRNGVYLAQQGCRVTGVDSSAVALQKARNLAAERGVQLNTLHRNLSELEIEPAAWDAVVSIFCHLPAPLRASLHRQVVQGLRPGGCLLLEAYTPRQLEFRTGGPPTIELMMDLKTLRQELKGLNLEHAREVERDIREGSYHNGRSAVVQILARKP